MFQLLPAHLHRPGLRPRRPARLVNKDGRCNIELRHGERLPLLVDVWTTVVEIRWRFVLALFVLAFTGSWFIFSLLWYSIARANGDLGGQNDTAGHVHCIDNVHGLTTAFLYSLETQTTIGYGGRALTGACTGTVVLLMLQSLVGVFINCFMCGLVLAKISLPKKRAKSVAFSEHAVVCMKSGRLCLLIRVANLRKTLLVGSHVYGKLLRTCAGADGEALVLDQLDVRFTVDAGADGLFFVCPLTLCHVIDRNSPLFALSVDTLAQQDFELVVFLDGTAESTSSSCHARTSYTPQEVLWGHAFLPIVSMTTMGKYRVDFSNFSRSVAVSTPHCARCFRVDDPGISNLDMGKLCQQGIDNPGFTADVEEVSRCPCQDNNANLCIHEVCPHRDKPARLLGSDKFCQQDTDPVIDNLGFTANTEEKVSSCPHQDNNATLCINNLYKLNMDAPNKEGMDNPGFTAVDMEPGDVVEMSL